MYQSLPTPLVAATTTSTMGVQSNVAETSRRVCVFGAERLIASTLDDLDDSIRSYRTVTAWRGAARSAMDASFAYCTVFRPFMSEEEARAFSFLESDYSAAIAERELTLVQLDESARRSRQQEVDAVSVVTIGFHSAKAVDASIISGKPLLDIECPPDYCDGATAPLTIRLSSAAFNDTAAAVLSLVLSRLRSFHRRQVMARFDALVRSGIMIVPLALSHFRQMVRDAYNKPGVFGPAVASFVKENLHLVPLYLEYLHVTAHRYDVSLVLSRWPFTTHGESLELFHYCWLMYGGVDAYDSVGLIAEWIIIANHRDRGDSIGAWQCTRDPYFQLVWEHWEHYSNDWSRHWIVKYLPLDLARLQVSRLREAQVAEARRVACLNTELSRRYAPYCRQQQRQEEHDWQEAKEKRQVHLLLLTMAFTAVKHADLYTKESLRRLLEALFEMAGVESGNHRDALEWVNAIASKEQALGNVALKPLVSYLEALCVQ